jgi:hypothetical protein
MYFARQPSTPERRFAAVTFSARQIAAGTDLLLGHIGTMGLRPN